MEIEFLKELSKKRPVDLIIPRFIKKEFLEILNEQTFLKELDSLKTECFEHPNSSQPSAKLPIFQNRCETRLNEVKAAVIQVLKWKKKGVAEIEIALLAPDMEEYWFCLKPHLEKNGISFKKGYSMPLIEQEEILFWLSKLRIHLSVFSFSDLETASFYTPPKKSFSEFYALFANAPERELAKTC